MRKTFLLLFTLLIAFLMLIPVVAFAETSVGIIRFIDAEQSIIRLDDNIDYVLPIEIDATKLEIGLQVQIDFHAQEGGNMITTLALVE